LLSSSLRSLLLDKESSETEDVDEALLTDEADDDTDCNARRLRRRSSLLAESSETEVATSSLTLLAEDALCNLRTVFSLMPERRASPMEAIKATRTTAENFMICIVWN
jgi:hypothetical protein